MAAPIFKITSSAQIIKTKLDVPLGISFPEFFHVGIRYQYAEIGQLGVYFGGDMGIKPSIIRTWTLDNMIHFGNVSYHSNRPVWYSRQGFTYSIHTEEARIYKYSYINMGVGHDFPLNSRLGINADMGFILQVREKMEFKDDTVDPWYRTNWYWKYLVRVQVYYSF
jgi:hypothetical protein